MATQTKNEQDGTMAHTFSQFTGFLKEGYPISKAAKKLGIARRTAYRWARRAVEEKLIEPTCAWPLLFRPKTKNGTHLKLVPNVPQEPLGIPHKYGATFIQLGRPHVLYDSRGKFTSKEGSHTVQFARSKAQIWIKHFRGLEAKEILANAYEDLMTLATHYSAKFGITLTLDRLFNGLEWVMISKETSEKANDLLEIGQKKELAGTLVKYDDSSHRGQIEINRLQGYPEHLPTVYWHNLEYLVTRGPLTLEQVIRAAEALKEGMEALNKRLKCLEARER